MENDNLPKTPEEIAKMEKRRRQRMEEEAAKWNIGVDDSSEEGGESIEEEEGRGVDDEEGDLIDMDDGNDGEDDVLDLD